MRLGQMDFITFEESNASPFPPAPRLNAKLS